LGQAVWPLDQAGPAKPQASFGLCIVPLFSVLFSILKLQKIV
jgi:hypothetical protein